MCWRPLLPDLVVLSYNSLNTYIYRSLYGNIFLNCHKCTNLKNQKIIHSLILKLQYTNTFVIAPSCFSFIFRFNLDFSSKISPFFGGCEVFGVSHDTIIQQSKTANFQLKIHLYYTIQPHYCITIGTYWLNCKSIIKTVKFAPIWNLKLSLVAYLNKPVTFLQTFSCECLVEISCWLDGDILFIVIQID